MNIMETPNTHSMPIGYLYWIFGFTGAHRFFYGRPITGTIWFFTFGLLGIGWLIDAFLIPGMDRKADRKYAQGSLNYSLSWVLLTFFGVFGLHRFYMGKWITGLIYFLTGGLFLFGYLYDLWTLNSQLSDLNAKEQLTGSR
ncbi:MAG: NINE protein [Pseudobdellovibrionaceae bacterium]